MSIDDPYTGKLSARSAKRLFFNAEDDESTKIVFELASRQNVGSLVKEEVRPEEKPIDPFAAIDERNAELDRIRHEQALLSDPTQTLVKEPVKNKTSSETVKLEDLPVVVKQAAEASIYKLLKKRR